MCNPASRKRSAEQVHGVQIVDVAWLEFQISTTLGIFYLKIQKPSSLEFVKLYTFMAAYSLVALTVV